MFRIFDQEEGTQITTQNDNIMITVKQILEEKGKDHFSVKSDSSVIDALTKMAEKNIGAMMVIDNGKLTGMFSERDFARNFSKSGHKQDAKVKDLMTINVISVNPNTTINECMAIMTQKHVRHLPVVDNNEIIGIISIGDVVNAIIHDQLTTIKDLEKYITGGY
jgi:CBS domain-containing protein